MIIFSADYTVVEDTITLNPVTNPRDCFAIVVIDDALQEGDEVVSLSVQLMTEILEQLQPSNLTGEILIVDDEIIIGMLALELPQRYYTVEPPF